MNVGSQIKTAEIRPPRFQTAAQRFAPTWFFSVAVAAGSLMRLFRFDPFALNFGIALCAATATLLLIVQRLPTQNVVGLAVVAALVGETQFLLQNHFGWTQTQLFHFQNVGKATIPFLWMTAVFLARGTAQFLLQRWRKSRNYGLWLIAVSSGLVAGIGFWRNHDLPLSFRTFLFAVVTLVLAVPLFIDKKSVEHKADFQPGLILGLFLLW